MSSISTSMFYLKPSETWSRVKPYFITVPSSALPKGQNTTNEESELVGDIIINDFRDRGFSLQDLDSCGFTFARQDFSTFARQDFVDYRSLRARYVPLMETWLRDILGTELVYTLSVNIRRRDHNFPEFTWGKSGDTQPIQGVHIGMKRHQHSVIISLNALDYTPRHALERIERELGAEKFHQIEHCRTQILKYRGIFPYKRDVKAADSF